MSPFSQKLYECFRLVCLDENMSDLILDYAHPGRVVIETIFQKFVYDKLLFQDLYVFQFQIRKQKCVWKPKEKWYGTGSRLIYLNSTSITNVNYLDFKKRIKGELTRHTFYFRASSGSDSKKSPSFLFAIHFCLQTSLSTLLLLHPTWKARLPFYGGRISSLVLVETDILWNFDPKNKLFGIWTVNHLFFLFPFSGEEKSLNYLNLESSKNRNKEGGTSSWMLLYLLEIERLQVEFPSLIENRNKKEN